MKRRSTSRLAGLFSLLGLVLFFHAGDSARAGLPPEILRSIVVAEGDDGRGSGFLVRMDKQVYVVTNAHVVSGNRKVTFKTLSNQTLTTGPLEVADDADLVRAPVSDSAVALQLAGRVDEKTTIGEKVVVAGNAEGAGVVREIPGTLVGIGPDRIEVDAAFVSGNSGSPILRPDGTVIGVATYARVPRFFRSTPVGGEAEITSLNEVRRFGYRLDTVAKWIKPAASDEIMRQGLKLKAFTEMTSAITFIASLGSAEIVRRGPAVPFVKEERDQNPTRAALAKAIENFAKQYPAAREVKEKETAVTGLFAALKAATTSDIGTDTAKNFSGYFAHRFEEELEHRKKLREWLDFLLTRASKQSWVVYSIWGRDEVSPSELSIHLTDQVDPSQPPEKRHKVSFPASSLPADLRGLWWVVETPANQKSNAALHLANFRVSTPEEGLYKVCVEYRRGGVTQKLSNVLELKVTDLAAARAEAAGPKSAPQQPLTIGPNDKPGPPDWKALAAAIAKSDYAETDIVGQDSTAKPIYDLPLPGSVLIGFVCIVEPFKGSPGIVHGLRPVYLTADGEKKGQTWGAQEGASEERTVAKPGYAVGRIYGRYDTTALRKIKVRFDRIVGLKLDSKDSYESPWVGVHEGKGRETSVDTAGRLAIGLGGHSGGGVDGVRLICLDAPAP